ncbi:hypothetical protein [Streptomyces stelliscabiei]|nr:hypothetical protein [Streptomyces stelliscabiei]MDX3435735.1 hypothetical protein [Streptomyces stelliscabiei]MDX3621966.1 hypothetical protein [Streptomyces stelliscabiei]
MHTRTTAFLDMAGAARPFPSWLDSLITGYSTHGVALFAVLMLAGWWQVVRQDAPPQALKALAAPVLTLIAFAASAGLKPQSRAASAHDGGLMNPATASPLAATAHLRPDHTALSEYLRLHPVLEE